jgi:hypothetical protein
VRSLQYRQKMMESRKEVIRNILDRLEQHRTAGNGVSGEEYEVTLALAFLATRRSCLSCFHTPWLNVMRCCCAVCSSLETASPACLLGALVPASSLASMRVPNTRQCQARHLRMSNVFYLTPMLNSRAVCAEYAAVSGGECCTS